ncbi:MAG: trypsin-like peptidase domain-containing protein [Proteobacteria bacterium]|nr:trypsin-like peptidase domain-containing protein [Burkholderiales bacterium]
MFDRKNSAVGARRCVRPLVAVKLSLLSSLCALGMALTGSVALAQTDTSEALFKRALQYTAQIRTIVTLPFEGDRKGAMRGAGFLVDAERGWVMTNSHVVSGSQALVQIAFTDNEFVDAKRIYVDPFLDLAILQVDPARVKGIAVPALECDRMPQVGHPVGAFGHPWGLRYTGTRGIISGITSRFEFEVLQTDAPINQGNSGGPLISLENGRIVAINTMTIRGAQNTNFAISSVFACRILRLLQQGIDPSPPELTWVTFRDIDERRMLRIARNFAPEGLALEAGDVIRGVVGVSDRVDNDTQLVHALRGRLDGFKLNVIRGGKAIELSGSLPPARRVLERRGILVGGVLIAESRYRDGPDVSAPLLVVQHVEPGSSGQSAEFGPGDLIESMSGRPVRTLEELALTIAEQSKTGRVVPIVLRRLGGGQRAYFTFLERPIRLTGVELIDLSTGPE